MLIKTITVGHLEANCYVVTDESTLLSAVIDPGDEANSISDYIEDNHLKPQAIFLTHGHHDHFRAAASVSEECGNIPIYLHKNDVAPGPKHEFYRFTPTETTRTYQEGDTFSIGSMTFRVIETPGHSDGSVCLICGDVMFTGDTLFHSSCGRTDLPGGDMDKLMDTLRKLYRLEGEYEIYPGHMDPTSLDKERHFNYYLRYAMETK